METSFPPPSIALNAFAPPNPYVFKIAAGKEQQKDIPEARYFRVLEADYSNFDCALDLGSWFPCDLARGYRAAHDEAGFRRISFRNNNANELNLLVECGRGETIDGRTALVMNRAGSAPSLIPSLGVEGLQTADSGALSTWRLFLAADANRYLVKLTTNDTTGNGPFFGFTNADTEAFSRNIRLTADVDGFVTIPYKGDIWIRHKTAGTEVRALVYSY